jgi:hypothetical protein
MALLDLIAVIINRLRKGVPDVARSKHDGIGTEPK